MFIIDPKALQTLKSSEGYNKEVSLENNNCYIKKICDLGFQHVAAPVGTQ